MIKQYAGQPEVASIFLKALTKKDAVAIAKAQTNNFLALSFHATLFGCMAEQFQTNMINLIHDRDPSVSKTVRQVIQFMKEVFFDVANDQLRNAIFLSLFQMLEFCFINKKYGSEQKQAKDLIIHPLFEELKNPKERVSRQTALTILRKLNSQYMQDPEIVNILHSHTLCALGIKHKIYDGEFLMAIVDLLNEHGIGLTLSECLSKAVSHFISSVQYNLTGQNASNKVHRDHHVSASLTVLAVLANNSIDTEYAKQIAPKHTYAFHEAMNLLNDEAKNILRLRAGCLDAWSKMEAYVAEQAKLQA